MLLFALGLLLSATPAKPNPAPPDSLRENPVAPCLDTISLMAKFQGGELEEVYRAWLGFFERTQRLRLDVDMPCHVQGKKVLGVLHLVLMNDTTHAIEALTNLSVNSPRTHLWDLNLPYEVQALWDSVRGEWGPELTADQIWEDHWLPPPLYEPNAPPRLYNLRKLYHDNRILYSLAGGKDPEPYIRILENTRKQDDPAFVLIRSDAMLRLGYGPKRIDTELANFSGPSSIIVAPYHLVGWRTRLSERSTMLAAGIEKKQEPKKKAIFPAPVLKQAESFER